MAVTRCEAGKMWGPVSVEPYGPLQLEPAATIINYGQGLFEGLKAYRTATGRIVLFRPEKNGARMSGGARRFLMPAIPTQVFLEAAGAVVRENADWVPPMGQGALYLRPLIFGSGSDLGVKPSSEYTFLVFASPVGSYFSGGGARMRLCVDHHRAAPLGVGHVKCAGNYAQCFNAQRLAKADGFSDVVYLDHTGTYIEEAAASNFFCVTEDGTVHTPQLGTILPGVTRDSIIQLVQEVSKKEGLSLNVGKLSAETALNAKEAFVCGTGAGITPIEHLASETNSKSFECPGPVTQKLIKLLGDVQHERVQDTRRWLYDPFLDSKSAVPDSFMEPTF